MHLLVAAHDLYPDPGSGGTGRYVYETGRRLVDRGHEVTVLTRRRGDAPRKGTIEGMLVRRYDLSIDGEHGLAIARQLPGAVESVREHLGRAPEPDLLSLQGTVTEPIVDALVPDRVPRSATFHSPWPVEYAIKAEREGQAAWRRGPSAWLRRAIERRGLRRSGEVIALSRFMAGKLGEVHSGVAEPAIVPGGVDPAVFHPEAGREERLREAEIAFLTVRRLSPRMGHHELLAAFERVAERHGRAELFVAGDGPLASELAAETRRRGLEGRVHWLGYVPDERLPGVLASADVFVLPTQRLEGFGLATLEALASGTPVVGTPVGATPEILGSLEAETAAGPMLAEGRDERALAEAMLEWARLDAKQRRRAGEQARAFAEASYAWDRVVDELEALYARQLG